MALLDVFKGFKREGREPIKFNKSISPRESELNALLNREIADEEQRVLDQLRIRKNNEMFGGGLKAGNDVLGARDAFFKGKKEKEINILKQRSLF